MNESLKQFIIQTISGPIGTAMAVLFSISIALHVVHRLINLIPHKRHYDFGYTDDDWKPESPIARPFWANRRDPDDPIRRG